MSSFSVAVCSVSHSQGLQNCKLRRDLAIGGRVQSLKQEADEESAGKCYLAE